MGELQAIGLTSARTLTLTELSRSVASCNVTLNVRAVVERPPAALGWPDAFLDSDLVVRKAMGESRAANARARSETWRPWRAYAVMHLWRNS